MYAFSTTRAESMSYSDVKVYAWCSRLSGLTPILEFGSRLNPPSVGHSCVDHFVLNVRAAYPVLNLLDVESFAQQVRAAGMLQNVTLA